MSFERQIQNRRDARDAEPAGEPSAALRGARAAAMPARAWAYAFYQQAGESGLPFAMLNDIVREHESLHAAMGAVAQKVAAGQGLAVLRKPAQADAAARISAAHAKAHQPRVPARPH